MENGEHLVLTMLLNVHRCKSVSSCPEIPSRHLNTLYSPILASCDMCLFLKCNMIMREAAPGRCEHRQTHNNKTTEKQFLSTSRDVLNNGSKYGISAYEQMVTISMEIQKK